MIALTRGWWLIFLCVLAAVLGAINYLHSAPFRYEMTMEVTPAQSSGADASRLNALGGLASLAGITLPNTQGGGSDFQLYLDTLLSRTIADELAKDPALMHKLFANQWDEATQSWHEPPPPTGWPAIEMSIQDHLGYPLVPWHQPDGESLYGFINYYVKVQQDPRKTYKADIIMTYPDPKFAVQFLNLLHETADNMLRQKTIQRTKAYIAYLTNTLTKTTIAEQRVAIAQALSEQEKSAMVAQSGSAYAADLFVRPWANSYPVSPAPTKTLLTAAAVGAFVGGFLAWLQWSVGNRFMARLRRKFSSALSQS
jgi:hypothetical protein